jgi:purine-binding chemotaxis protein CheW
VINSQEQKKRKDHFVLIVSFAVGGENFGVDILPVQEIDPAPTITRSPNTPEYVDGMLSFHGKLVPVINMRRRFGLPRKQWDQNARIIVVEQSEKHIGFFVERMDEIVRVPIRTVKTASPFPGEMKADYISAVAHLNGRRLNLLDLEKILRLEKELLNGST